MANKRIINPERIKKINTAEVYRMIDQQGPISRIGLAHQTQLAGASITKITRQLLQVGLIREDAPQQSTGGRRAISLVAERTGFFLISGHLAEGKLDLSLFDLSGTQHGFCSTPMPEQDREILLQHLVDILQRFITDSRIEAHRLIALAMTLPGIINSHHGIVVDTPYYALHNFPLASYLAEYFSLPVYVGNDTRAITLAEYYSGSAQGIQDIALIAVNSEASAGMIIDGKLFVNSRRDVGEIGHIQLDALGQRCTCGNIGCANTICSNKAIIAAVKQQIDTGHPCILDDSQLDVCTICHAAQNGDALCQEVIQRAGQALGKIIAIIINLFNPKQVLLTGEITGAWDLLYPAIKQCINDQALATFRTETHIAPARYHHRSTIGGMALVKRALLNGELLKFLEQRKKEEHHRRPTNRLPA